MKKLLLALTLFAFAPRLATAQDVKNPVVLEKVTYSRDVPKGLRAFVPRGGKSRFWGETKLRFEGKPVWVHVYNVTKPKTSREKDGDLFGTQKSGLDLFALSSSRRLKRIYSTRFDYNIYDVIYKRLVGSELIGVETLWLDPNDRKMPIVKIVLNGIQGRMEDAGVLIIFNRGLRNGIVQQGFGSGANGGGASGGSWYTHFDQIDEGGLLKIVHNYSTFDGTEYTTYRWNGKQFVQSSRSYVVREQ